MTNLKATARITTNAEGIDVTVVWSGAALDRTAGMGYGLKLSHRALAARLAAAINAGAAMTDPVIKTDVNGHTYVSSTINVWGRRMNADLKRLGF